MVRQHMYNMVPGTHHRCSIKVGACFPVHGLKFHLQILFARSSTWHGCFSVTKSRLTLRFHGLTACQAFLSFTISVPSKQNIKEPPSLSRKTLHSINDSGSPYGFNCRRHMWQNEIWSKPSNPEPRATFSMPATVLPDCRDTIRCCAQGARWQLSLEGGSTSTSYLFAPMGMFSPAKVILERFRPLRQGSDTAGESDRELDASNVSRAWEHLLGSFQAFIWFL